jgi:TolB-like protein
LSGIVPTGEEIAQALERILAWPEIVRSPQLGNFLAYIVQRTLASDSTSIKAYSIAVDVFGRPVDFDPQADPIVRVQARRLRALLEQYYQSTGANDAVRIELPVGRYVPSFRYGADSNAPAPTDIVLPTPIPEDVFLVAKRREFAVAWFALAVLTMALAIFAYGVSTWGREAEKARAFGLLTFPHVRVLEFQTLGQTSDDVARASGLAVELVSALQKFESFTVSYGSSGAEDDPVQEINGFLLSGIVRREAGVVRFSTILSEAQSRTVVWSTSVDITEAEDRAGGTLQRVSAAISRALGSPRGPLHARARTMLGSQPVQRGAETLYLCQVLFDMYREHETQARAANAVRCFDGLPMAERTEGRAVASLASIMAEVGLGGEVLGIEGATPLQIADTAMSRAVQDSPTSSFVWEQRARLHERLGRFEQAEAAYGSALQLNSANTDAMAARARHLALNGRLREAEPLSIGALSSSPEAPDWYRGVPALLAIRDGDLIAAIDYAERYAQADQELGPILVVIAAQMLGDNDLVNTYLPRILEEPHFRELGILPRLDQHIGNADLLRETGEALLRAGVPQASLEGPF